MMVSKYRQHGIQWERGHGTVYVHLDQPACATGDAGGIMK